MTPARAAETRPLPPRWSRAMDPHGVRYTHTSGLVVLVTAHGVHIGGWLGADGIDGVGRDVAELLTWAVEVGR